jgi:DNA polymerase
MENCRPFLDEQIAIVAPAVILALGSPAAKSFLGRDFQITRMRGRWYLGPGETPLMVTFHPAYILRQTGGEIEGVKRLVWDDLKAVRARLDEAQIRPAEPVEVHQAGLFE